MNNSTMGALLREVARLHTQLQHEQITCCGTTATQCSILTELGRNGPMTLAELGRRLGLDKGWLSRTVEALAQEGLLTKEPGLSDHRTVQIALSQAGQVRYQELNQSLNGLSERVMERLAPTDRATVQRTLELLQQALVAERATAPDEPLTEQERSS